MAVSHKFSSPARLRRYGDPLPDGRAIISQRAVRRVDDRSTIAIEIWINTPHVAVLVPEGHVENIDEAMASCQEGGMIMVDHALLALDPDGCIFRGNFRRMQTGRPIWRQKDQLRFEAIKMLVTFRTPAHADITMFGDVAKALIHMMGHSGSIPGAILAADLPQALEKLKAAVASNPDVPLNPGQDDDEDRREQSVSLAHRALPLIDLLEAAVREEKNLMWDS